MPCIRHGALTLCWVLCIWKTRFDLHSCCKARVKISLSEELQSTAVWQTAVSANACFVVLLSCEVFCFAYRSLFSPYKTFYLVLVTEKYTYEHSYSSKLLLCIFYSAVAVFPPVVKEVCGKGYYSGGGKLDFCTRCDQSTWKYRAEERLSGSAHRNASAPYGRLLAQIQAPPWDQSLVTKIKSLWMESENKIIANTIRMTFLVIM